MEGIKFAVYLTCCSILLTATLSASLPTSKELIQKLEEWVEELTETLNLLKESHAHAKRQTTTCILNENGKLKLSTMYLYVVNSHTHCSSYISALIFLIIFSLIRHFSCKLYVVNFNLF